MHPLDDAYLRLDRAEEHLAEMRKLVSSFLDSERDAAIRLLRINPEPGVPFEFTRSNAPVPKRISILTGNVVQELRTALNYLVAQLANLDAGRPVRRTQFPIEDKPEGFHGKRNLYLKGVNDPHAASIERLQPYNGVNWAQLLRTLSNPDKHDHLITLVQNNGLVATAHVDPAKVDIVPHSGGLRFVGKQDGQEINVRMEFLFSFYVAFDDGTPVHILDEIKAQVTQTLDVFKPEFK